MPENLRHAAFIQAALPNARFIHMRRKALDNALSIWTTAKATLSWSGYDRSDIVEFFGEHLRVAQHVRLLLPADRFLEVDYEDLVHRSEESIRRMVDFLGLEWDPACLLPEKNPRSVLTPSAVQVRQPIYPSSIGRAERFRPWLGELLELERPYEEPSFLE